MKRSKSAIGAANPNMPAFKEPPSGVLARPTRGKGTRVSQLSKRCARALTIVLVLVIIYFTYSLLKIFAGFMLASEIHDFNKADWKKASSSKKFWLVLEFVTPFVLLLLFLPLLFYLGVAFQTFDVLFLNHNASDGDVKYGGEVRETLRNIPREFREGFREGYSEAYREAIARQSNIRRKQH